MKESSAKRVDEQLRRVSSRITKQIALWAGDHYGMKLGAGYPKSGTSWMCELLSSYLDLPHPQNYSSPIAMAAVLQNHWPYDPRFPASVYIVRDGRDVLVSMYFYFMRAITQARHPRTASKLHTRFTEAFGAGYDRDDVSHNLPRFVELQLTQPVGIRWTWPEHVSGWTSAPHANVCVTSYEAMLEDAAHEFSRVIEWVTEKPAAPDRVARVLAAHAFQQSGRAAGEEDRTSFMRKGIRGDWRNHFTPEAAEIFEKHAGDTLRALGYETDPRWYEAV